MLVTTLQKLIDVGCIKNHVKLVYYDSIYMIYFRF